MPNYNEAKIYRLVADGFDPYYGSTTLSLDLRFRCFKNTKKIYSCSQFIHSDSCRIELVELYPCETRLELMKRERYWIDNNKCVNQSKPFRSNLEAKQYHRTYMREYIKTYKLDHPEHKPTKEKSAQYCKKWYDKKRIYLGWLKDFNL